MRINPMIPGAMVLALTAGAAEAAWTARTESSLPFGSSTPVFAQVQDDVYTSGPAGFEGLSSQLSRGTVETGFGGTVSASLEARELNLFSSVGARQSAVISDTLSNLRNETSNVTLHYRARWVPLAGVELDQPGDAGVISLAIEVFYPTLGSEIVADWAIDLADTPCPFVNQDCRTNDVISLKEIPDKVTYRFGFTSYSGGLVETFFDYSAWLDIGFAEILRCPPGAPFLGSGFCVTPVPHDGGPGVGPGGPGGGGGFWPPVTRVPEPDTWALLIAGFGLVGVAARRRRPARA